MLELAEELVARGHQVTVITTWPEYNLDQREQQKHFNELEIEGSIKVIRVKTLPHHNVNYIVRALSQLLMPVQFLLKLRRYKVQADAVVVYSPPLPLAFVGSWLRRKGVRNLLNVQDLFPQNAIDLGILRSKLQIRFFRALERFAYRTADIVTVHSEGNQKMLLEQNPTISSKLRILHNWVDVDHHAASETGVDYRKQWDIKQKYVAVFAGVMGPSQYLELILGVAERMQEQEDLLFLLVGDGKEKERLQQIAKDKNLNNVRFEGFISRDTYPDLLNACDIGLVCLSPQNQTPVVPGKILGHMAAGLPVEIGRAHV
jgi:glycosyltransferase involved in cell wall biosynthesis